ncbi:MAG TPA: AAA family ATPase [Jatrophihabitans sp.]|nr:AAA family ATPase [Jatrophihabitans sp.]
MAGRLLERDDAIEAFQTALEHAVAGSGSTVLVTGEAGIGKTSVVRACVATLDRTVRLLSGGCDDLLAPRTLGPLRDAVRGTGGALADALRDGSSDVVFAAVAEELSRPPPTVLVVEDVHWADDATLDLLSYAVRRVADWPAVLLLSFRDDARSRQQPIERLLAATATVPAYRLRLLPLSTHAVSVLAAGTGRPAAALHKITGGNPFFLSEVLAASPGEVPTRVADLVLARMHQLGPAGRAALEQLSVIPTMVTLDLAGSLLERPAEVLAEAEAAGLLEVRGTAVTFRHELARRAIADSLPVLRRRAANAAVVQALRTAWRIDRPRIVHHAVAAGDGDTVVKYAPEAAREASDAGSHRQALTLLEAVRPYANRLGELDRARLLDDYAWELYNAHRFEDAVAAGQEAVERYERLGERVMLGEALVRQSRHIYMTGRTEEAERAIERAVCVLEGAGSDAALAYGLSYAGAILALTGRHAQATATLDRARALAARNQRPDLEALCLNYLGVVQADLSGPAGLAALRRSLELAQRDGWHEYVARGYTNLAELLFRFGHYDELAGCVADGLEFTRERGFWSHAYNLELHRCLLLLRTSRWAEAEAGLRALVERVDEPGMLYVYSVPPLARLLARQGSDDAAELVTTAWQRAVPQKSLLGVAYAGIAYVEWAWLRGGGTDVDEVTDVVLARTEEPGAAPLRGEFLRYLARLGRPVPPPAEGMLPGHRAGLAGDWQAAARTWHEVGDRYEEALELAESGQVEPTRKALRLLDELGASAAADRVRDRLRALGVARIPRGPQASTRANPVGLTDRQLDVLALLVAGHTNAEIAQRLVLSVRTVDNHVAAVLDKLGVSSRRAAAERARALGL